MAITIIGLPWARAARMMAAYTLLPFGQTVVRRDLHDGRTTIGTGLLGVVGNVVWLVVLINGSTGEFDLVTTKHLRAGRATSISEALLAHPGADTRIGR